MHVDFTRAQLAINGGLPVHTELWKDNFTTGEEEKRAVTRVLDSGYLSLFEGSHQPDMPFSFSGGPEVQSFEDNWSEYYGSRYSISLNSATSGLFAAIGALGLGYGDEVIVSPYTMTACALAPLIYGAIPVFADVDPNTGCIDAKSLQSKISKYTKAILIVHQFGFPADMHRIMEIAKKNNLKVIEDCAQAHAASLSGKSVGLWGDIGVFSLNVNKTIQAGEGGVCITNSSELAYRLKLIRNHGEAVVGPASYSDITNIAGFNYRMTEITAAIANEQLKKLPEITAHRLEMVDYMISKFKTYECLSPLKGIADYDSTSTSVSTYYVFPFTIDIDSCNFTREEFVNTMKAEGILFYPGYVKPLYLQPMYQRKTLFKSNYPFSAPPNLGLNQSYHLGICPVAEHLHFRTALISEHIRPPHTIEDLKDIIKALDKVLLNLN